jgi:hypothetical protein
MRSTSARPSLRATGISSVWIKTVVMMPFLFAESHSGVPKGLPGMPGGENHESLTVKRNPNS